MSTTIGRLSDPPTGSPVIGRTPDGSSWTGMITRAWIQWLIAVLTRLSSAATVLKATSLDAQGAAIVTVAAWTTLAAGLYRVSYCVRVAQAATTASSLTVTLGWTRRAVGLVLSGAAIVDGIASTAQTGTMLVRADAPTDLTYAVAYASTGATPMLYELDVVVEQVPNP